MRFVYIGYRRMRGTTEIFVYIACRILLCLYCLHNLPANYTQIHIRGKRIKNITRFCSIYLSIDTANPSYEYTRQVCTPRLLEEKIKKTESMLTTDTVRPGKRKAC